MRRNLDLFCGLGISLTLVAAATAAALALVAAAAARHHLARRRGVNPKHRRGDDWRIG